MKIYVAGRVRNKENIRQVYEMLENEGHEITYKWTEQESILPLKENMNLVKKYLQDDFNAIRDADCVLMIA
jgi:nucleoside 2-deoxyribosyltransferase